MVMEMKQANKIRVAVLYGGRSVEHEVSVQSAANVMQYLDPTLFEVVPVGIDKQGNWFLGHDMFAKSLANKTMPKLDQQSEPWFTAEWVGKANAVSAERQIAKKSNDLQFDVVFPVLHGTYCEDGTLQGLLELANLPYVGCSVLASAIGMDKDVSKRLAMQAGINVAPYLSVKSSQWLANPDRILKKINNTLTLPLFVKPANAGSSIGISKVKTEAELSAAIIEAFKFDTKILIEKALDILELEIAVLESLELEKDPLVSVVGEIKPSHEFYSYDAKYIDEKGAELLIPAPIPAEIQKAAQAMAKDLFQILECEGMARIDLFLEKETQTLYFNEINTIPGFTKISMYPKLMEASGMSYSNLLTYLIQLAIKRHQQKSQLMREFLIN